MGSDWVFMALAREYLRVAEQVKAAALEQGNAASAEGAQREIERWRKVLEPGYSPAEGEEHPGAITTYLVAYTSEREKEGAELPVEAASARAARERAYRRLVADPSNKGVQVGQPRLAVPPVAEVGSLVQFGWGARATWGVVCEPHDAEFVYYHRVWPHDSMQHTMMRVFLADGGPRARVRQMWRTGDGRRWHRETDPAMDTAPPGKQRRTMVTVALGAAEDISNELER